MTPLTDQIYWESKSPEILAMVVAIQKAKANPPTGYLAYAIARAVATSLALQGRTGQADLVDVPIMVWGYGPTYTMTFCKSLGEAWEPSALTPPVEVLPGLVVPGMPSYDPNNPPPLAIKVSIDAADYPAYKASPGIAVKEKGPEPSPEPLKQPWEA
jgi:hypothetical protein